MPTDPALPHRHRLPPLSHQPRRPSPSSSSSSADTYGFGQQVGPGVLQADRPLRGRVQGGCQEPAATKAKPSANGKKLNLTAPDVSTVVPEQELKEPLPNTEQVTEVQESQTVSVKTNEGVPPDVPGGLGAIWWAVVHPSQAWRIVTPAE